MSRVEGWRAALREVANLGGMVLKDGYEPQFIQNIVKEVGNKVPRIVINVAPYLVGIDSRIKPINLWVQDGSNDVGIATIYGIGGIGKTTVAKMVYNMNVNNFEGKSFLANVREISEQPNGLVCLQRQLLSDLLKRKANKIYNVDQGTIKIKDAIRCKKVLLILDDVDQLDQFNAIVGLREWFCPGSKIIITTRHERLLRDHEVSVTFKVEELHDNESLQLFSWHAFGQDHPMHGYKKLSSNVVQHCGGLPLALQVLGSSLFGKTEDVWESALQKLETIADSKIQKILRTSYDSLQDDHDKNLFLDVACFFTRMRVDYVVKILDGCNFFTTIGIQILIDRCLISISEENKLMMHELVRDMAKEIVRQESPDYPGERSRLWNNKESLTVLRENTGTESIRGLNLKLAMLMDDKRMKKIATASYGKRPHNKEPTEKLMLPYLGNYSDRQHLNFFSWESENNAAKNSFSTTAFAKMQNLKMLHLKDVKLNGSYKDFPRSLIWLRWHGLPLSSIPNDFYLEKLAVLDIRYSNLKHVWKGIKFLVELKILNLSHAHGLVRTPNFTGLPSLEMLVLKDCINLVEVDESIGDLERLALLNLKDCKSLKKLPTNITLLKSLKELFVSGCSSLGVLPEVGKFDPLRNTDATAINQIDVFKTRDWRKFCLSLWNSAFWSGLLRQYASSTRFSLGFLPSSLVGLSLVDCSLSNSAIPNDLSCLPSLQYLNMSGNLMYCLPESINNLTVLKSLVLHRCIKLQSLPQLPTSLNCVWALNCTSLERIENQPHLLSSLRLLTYGSDKLVEVQGLFKLEPIGNTNTEILNALGLSCVELLEGTKVEMFNALSYTKIMTTIKVLHECGIFSIFLAGSEVPECFCCQGNGSSISFDVLRILDHKIRGLSLCVVYGCDDQECGFEDENCVEISNETKSLKWTYVPTFFGIPKPTEDMLWLSHWMTGDELEAGDKMHISVVMTPGFYVKEWGIRVMYEQETDTQLHSTEIVQSTPPWYRMQLFQRLWKR